MSKSRRKKLRRKAARAQRLVQQAITLFFLSIRFKLLLVHSLPTREDAFGARDKLLCAQGIVAGRDMTAAGKADLRQLHGYFNRGLLPGGITGCASGPSLLSPGRHARLGRRTGAPLTCREFARHKVDRINDTWTCNLLKTEWWS